MTDIHNKRLFSLLLLGVLVGIYPNKSVGQEKVNISVGVGMPELIHLGARYQLKQIQVGIGVGTWPVRDESMFSFSGDLFYHFAGTSELSDRRPWYGRAGLNHLREETEYTIYKYLHLNLRFGREFNISKRMGIEIDAGAIFQLSHQEIEKVPTSSWIDLEFPVLPSAGIGLFYRL